MIKQLKLSIKLVRYGYGFKMCIGFMIFFAAVGMLLLVCRPLSNTSAGVFPLLISGLWISQLFSSLGVSRLVQSSPWKRAAETAMPAMLGFLSYGASYVLLLLLRLPRLVGATAEETAYMAAELVLDGVLVFVLMVYSSMAYKFFVVSTVLFFAVYFGLSGLSWLLTDWLMERVALGQGAAIGILLMLLGGLAEYGVACLLYKYPLAKNAQLRALAKLM